MPVRPCTHLKRQGKEENDVESTRRYRGKAVKEEGKKSRNEEPIRRGGEWLEEWKGERGR